MFWKAVAGKTWVFFFLEKVSFEMHRRIVFFGLRQTCMQHIFGIESDEGHWNRRKTHDKVVLRSPKNSLISSICFCQYSAAYQLFVQV